MIFSYQQQTFSACTSLALYITNNSICSLHQLLLLPLENHNAIDSSSPPLYVLVTVSTAHHHLIYFFFLVEGDHFTYITFSLVEHHHPFQPFSASSSSPLSFQLTIFLSCCVCVLALREQEASIPQRVLLLPRSVSRAVTTIIINMFKPSSLLSRCRGVMVCSSYGG